METWLNPQGIVLANVVSITLLTACLFQFWIWGLSFGKIARKLFPNLQRRKQDLPTLTAELLTGLLLFGMAFFLTSWFSGSLPLSALALFVVTVALFSSQASGIQSELRTGLKVLQNKVRSLNKRERWIVFFLSALVILNLSRATILQNHGDQYLYHLAIGRIWTDAGQPLVTVNNITSGYSWSVELIYAYFRQIVGGDSTLILLSQQTHAFISFIGSLVFSYSIIRPYLSRAWSLAILIVFLSPHLNQMNFYAKNDGIAFLLAYASLYFSLKRRWSDLLLLSPFVLSAKITTALSLAAIGIVSIIRELMFTSKDESSRVIGMWLLSGTLAVIGIGPYLFANFVQTGNPFFPLMNNIFQSALAPQTAKSLVGEMAPLQITFSGFLQGWLVFLKEHIAILICFPIAAYVYFQGKKEGDPPANSETTALFATAILAMAFLQICLNQYGNGIEARHFKIVQYTLPVSLIILTCTIGAIRMRRTILACIVIGGVSVSHFDVLVRDFVKLSSVHNLKEHYFSRRPFNKVFNDISERPELCDSCHVIAVGKFIEGYFLKRGVLLMPNINGTLFIAKTTSADAMNATFDQIHQSQSPIQFGVIEDGYESTVEGQWIQKNLQPILQHENYKLFGHLN